MASASGKGWRRESQDASLFCRRMRVDAELHEKLDERVHLEDVSSEPTAKVVNIIFRAD